MALDIRTQLLTSFPRKNLADEEAALAQMISSTLKIKLITREQVTAVMRTLFPQAFLSPNAKELHGTLEREYPELMRMMKGAEAYFTAFPSAGIPAQAAAIAKQVDPRFNAGIGIGKDQSGHVFVHPLLADLFAKLRPQGASDETWKKIQDEVFGYGKGLGQPWYRKIARERYLLDAGDGREEVEKALRIDPIPISGGGTLGLDVMMSLTGAAGGLVAFPAAFWGNMKLKCDHHGLMVLTMEDAGDGALTPDVLRSTIREVKEFGGYQGIRLYFNEPRNPTASYPTEAEAMALAEVARDEANDRFFVVVYCDEPYYPFVRGKDAAKRPLSSYMTPGSNRNMLTFVNINGTKRDGFYGVRHSDLLVLTPENLSDAAVSAFENGKIAGWLRGLTSFPNGLNQYLLARAMTGDPLVPFAKGEALEPEALRDKTAWYRSIQDDMMSLMDICVERMRSSLREVRGLRLVEGAEGVDASGGFFLSCVPDAGISPMDVHRKGLSMNCGVIAAGPYVRLNASSILEDDLPGFIRNLQSTMQALGA